MEQPAQATRRSHEDTSPMPGQSGEVARWTAAANEARRQLAALDAATVAISQELSLERILQIIVDSVRPLVGARYAALGIPDERGVMENFVTSGISPSERALIGHPPVGLGLLGVAVREGITIRVDDIAADPRSAGFPPHHPPMRRLLSVPVKVEGRAIGNLYLTDREDGQPFTPDDAQLVESFARHAGLAIHNARLHLELRELAVLQERERIAQDLHDGSIQSLYAVSLSLEDVEELVDVDRDLAFERIERAIDQIHATIAEIRDFITGLDPAGASAVELLAGLDALSDEFRVGTDIEVELTGDPDIRLDADASLQLIRLAREALSNVARHAGATHVQVAVEDGADGFRLSIIDDGRGFDTTELQRPGHHGLTNMQARAESLGGTLAIDSDEAGTKVVFSRARHDQATHEESRP